MDYLGVAVDQSAGGFDDRNCRRGNGPSSESAFGPGSYRTRDGREGVWDNGAYWADGIDWNVKQAKRRTQQVRGDELRQRPGDEIESGDGSPSSLTTISRRAMMVGNPFCARVGMVPDPRQAFDAVRMGSADERAGRDN
jgi:hypothetical protein